RHPSSSRRQMYDKLAVARYRCLLLFVICTVAVGVDTVAHDAGTVVSGGEKGKVQRQVPLRPVGHGADPPFGTLPPRHDDILPDLPVERTRLIESRRHAGHELNAI